VLRPLTVAFGFLTRVPVPTGAVEPRDLARSLTWFPAVGAVLGAAMYGGGTLLGGALAPGVVAVALVALHAGATGGLHLDGVADVFDALGGGCGQRERMLAILRDSRIGAHGAAALVLVLAAKIAAVAALLDGHAWALYASPVAARWAVVPLVIGFPYARPEGLGKPFHGHAGPAQLAGATITAALAIGWLGAPVIAPTVAAAAAGLAIASWLRRYLGGLTGDVYGAAIEAAELAFLVVAGLR
jgi:adenosylcobinamide-GDP ribazoletransferase